MAAVVTLVATSVAVVSAPSAAFAVTGADIVSIAQREAADSTRNYEIGNNCSFYGGAVFNWPACGGMPGWGGGADENNWCAAFAKYVWSQAGVASYLSEITGFAETFQWYGQNHGTYHANGTGYTPQPGDAVVFDWDHSDTDPHPIDHVGIVISVSGSTLNTIEGNVTKNQSDGVFTQTHTSYASDPDVIGFTTAVGVSGGKPGGLLGDFDGDGKPDVAAMSADRSTLYISRNTSTPGNPSKASGTLVSSGWATVNNMMIVDFDGDGKADILGRNGDSLLAWRSTSTATAFSFAPYVNLGTGNSSVSRYLIGDFDGDTKPDIAAWGSDGSTLYISKNLSTPGTLAKGAGVLVSSGWAGYDNLMVADFDGDHKADLLGRSGDHLLVWPSTSTGSGYSFAPSVDLGGGSSTVSRFLTPVDYDGDGKPDVAAFSGDGSTLYISRNLSTPGNPAKASGSLVSSGWATYNSLMVGDFDHDGKADVLARGGDSLLTWRSTSTSTAYSVAPSVNLGGGSSSVSAFLTSVPA